MFSSFDTDSAGLAAAAAGEKYEENKFQSLLVWLAVSCVCVSREGERDVPLDPPTSRTMI